MDGGLPLSSLPPLSDSADDAHAHGHVALHEQPQLPSSSAPGSDGTSIPADDLAPDASAATNAAAPTLTLPPPYARCS
jgi:hypothetical protein